MILSPILYIILSLVLFATGKYQLFHNSLDYFKVFNYIELSINYGLFWIFNQILKIDKINKFYLLVKVKIFLYFFKILATVMPEKEENKLENELQHVRPAPARLDAAAQALHEADPEREEGQKGNQIEAKVDRILPPGVGVGRRGKIHIVRHPGHSREAKVGKGKAHWNEYTHERGEQISNVAVAKRDGKKRSGHDLPEVVEPLFARLVPRTQNSKQKVDYHEDGQGMGQSQRAGQTQYPAGCFVEADEHG